MGLFLYCNLSLCYFVGSGDHAVFNQDQFERRMDVVNAQGHYGVAVLHGLQYSVAKLSHPPSEYLTQVYCTSISLLPNIVCFEPRFTPLFEYSFILQLYLQ